MDFTFENKNELTRKEFEKAVKFNNWEVFSSKEVKDYSLSIGTVIKKSADNELTEEEKKFIDVGKQELQNLTPITVIDDNLLKSLYYVQEKQVEFVDTIEKSIDGSPIQEGTFLDTPLNRKLGRVGQTFIKGNYGKGKNNAKMMKEKENMEKAMSTDMYKAYANMMGKKEEYMKAMDTVSKGVDGAEMGADAVSKAMKEKYPNMDDNEHKLMKAGWDPDGDNQMLKILKGMYADMDKKQYKMMKKAYHSDMYNKTMKKAGFYRKMMNS